jgi:membrane fusion protein (multidrug efflux system)
LVRAPFSGRLGIRAINLGQYLTPGTGITTLEAIDSVFVDFTVPQQRLADVLEGTPVRVSLQTKNWQLQGSIAAVDPSIDATTRAVRLRATVPNGKEKLRPGMFVDVAVLLPKKTAYVTVPATAIVHAPYGDSVFVVEDKKPDEPGMRQTPDGKPVMAARQRFVRLGARRGDFVAILQGVQAKEQVVIAGAFKLRNGSPVFVSDVALPRPELEPRPQNR